MSRVLNFALIGAAGFVAPRHMKAIKAIGGKLIAAYDIHDSVGILDSYFPECYFTTSFEEFDSYLSTSREATNMDYLVVCSPNYLHDQHVIFGLKKGLDIICEKPLALSPEKIKNIQQAEVSTGKKVNTILQLRLHPSLNEIREIIETSEGKLAVSLEYFAPRGKWYHKSWKGDEEKSGGILMNIGVHFFDLLYHLFGNPLQEDLHHLNDISAKGILLFEKATVNWELSIDLSEETAGRRGLVINGKRYDFTDEFKKLHIASYEAILNGQGFGSKLCLPSVEMVTRLRTKNSLITINE